MKRLLTIILLVAATIATVSSIAPTVVAQGQTAQASPSADQSVRAVNRLFAPWNRSDLPGCSVAISQNGTLVYERGYGMANLEYGIAITPASVFDVGSISKQFTAMAILILAQRGQLSLDDDVRKYITELPDYGNRLTIRHLLTHTGGLRHWNHLLHFAGWRLGDVQTNDDMVKILARQKALTTTPGVSFGYSNTGYAVLAVIVKRVSGQSLRAFSDSNIFKPLGMTQTHFHDDPTMIVPNRASGYYFEEPGGLHVASQAGGDIVGNGHLYTTARDLLIWEQNFADVRVGDRALVAAMQTPTVLTGGDTSFYGFGLSIGLDRGLRTIGHGGSDPGWSANVARYPDQGLAVAVLCNLESIDADALVPSVAAIYLADVYPTPTPTVSRAVPPAVSLSSEQLASHVGLYRDPSIDALRRIFVRDGKLMAFDVTSRAAEGPGTELAPVTANRFVRPGGTVLEFVPAVAGRARELHQLAGGQKPLVFQQVDAFAPSSTELREFAGEYVSPELDTTYTLAVRDSELVIQTQKWEVVLRPTFKDAFWGGRVGWGNLTVVKFSRDARGVTGFTVSMGANGGPWFDRVKR